jgi:predicted Co/Zn/Cd cation transporter (cation efflux family)
MRIMLEANQIFWIGFWIYLVWVVLAEFLRDAGATRWSPGRISISLNGLGAILYGIYFLYAAITNQLLGGHSVYFELIYFIVVILFTLAAAALAAMAGRHYGLRSLTIALIIICSSLSDLGLVSYRVAITASFCVFTALVIINIAAFIFGHRHMSMSAAA